MQDSFYHMTLKSHLIRIKTSIFRQKKTRCFYGRQHITHIESTSGLSFIMHGFITLPGAMLL